MRRSAVVLSAVLLALATRANAQPTTADFNQALYRYMPVMRFDNGFLPFIDDTEHFFPLRVSAITNNPGNVLHKDGTNPERHDDGTGLNIGWLRAGTYPDGQPVHDSDFVDERSNDLDVYKADAARFQSDPHYRDRIYGHVVPVHAEGFLAGAWLQYWFFYYYNDFPGATLGDHEGDWEMIQVFVDVDLKPQVAVYAHHNGKSYCPWAKVQKERSRPIVYVARGSHASYFHDGHHGQDLFVDGDNERPMKLIRIGDHSPRWVNWPGFWGASGGVFGEFHSPNGPSQHSQFFNPQKFYEDADLDSDCN